MDPLLLTGLAGRSTDSGEWIIALSLNDPWKESAFHLFSSLWQLVEWGPVRACCRILQRVCVKFCFKTGKSASETYELLKTAFGDNCMSQSNVFVWFNRFKNGRESFEDEPRSGRPSTSKTNENVVNLPLQDRQLTRNTTNVSLSVCAKRCGRKGLHCGKTGVGCSTTTMPRPTVPSQSLNFWPNSKFLCFHNRPIPLI